MVEKKVLEVTNLETFLEKSQNGENRIFQLHRKLGGVFLDVSFQDDHYIYTCRIDVDSPKHQQSVLCWSDNSFPYEEETYVADEGSTVTVKLYRDLPALRPFLEDVVFETNIEEWPTTIKDSLKGVGECLDSISEAINSCLDMEIEAIENGLGIDLDHIDGMGRTDVFICYLTRYIQEKWDLYAEAKDRADQERRQIFRDLEARVVDTYIQRLQKHGFNKGFINK